MGLIISFSRRIKVRGSITQIKCFEINTPNYKSILKGKDGPAQYNLLILLLSDLAPIPNLSTSLAHLNSRARDFYSYLIINLKTTKFEYLIPKSIAVPGKMGSWFSTPWDPSTGIPDLTGKVAIVTGAKLVSSLA
jgi:hypothetical protein